MPTPSARPRPWWLAIAVIMIGALCLYGAAGLPQGARYAGVGPGMFVTVVGAALVILGIILGVQIAQGEEFVPQDAEDAAGDVPPDFRAFATAMAAAFAPVLLMEHFGLPLTAMVSFALVARAFGSRRLVVDLVTGAILGVAAWFLFSQLGLQLGGFLPIAGV